MGDPFELLNVIEDYVARATAPLQKRIATLEAQLDRVPRQGEKGEPGRDAEVDYDRIGNVISVAVEKEVRKIPIPENGRDGRDGAKGDPGEPGRDGRDGKDGAAGERGADGAKGEQGERGEKGADGAPGRDASPEAIAAAVDKALAAWPRPKDGRDGVDGKDAPPLDYTVLEQWVRGFWKSLPIPERGEPGPPGAKGEDGQDGRDGQRGPEGPAGPAGEPGRDAVDGLLAIEASMSGDRTFALDFLMRGGRRKSFEFRLPIPIYRGLHKDGMAYERGDAVTRDGSTWYALKDTDSAPPSSEWMLGVKKGRDLR